MAPQEIVALAIVALTAGIFVWKFLRPRGFKIKSGGCGCSTPKQNMPSERVIFHARKGERPQIIVKPK